MTSDVFNHTSRPRIAGKSKEELAAIAYDALAGLEFVEMNDGHRLGYHIYRYLMGELASLANAIYEAKARTPIAADELERIVGERLDAAGRDMSA